MGPLKAAKPTRISGFLHLSGRHFPREPNHFVKMLLLPASLCCSWLVQVAEGAAELYVAQLGQLRGLTPQGSAQLAADLEYFCNVVSALGVSIPTALATWQVDLGPRCSSHWFNRVLYKVSCANAVLHDEKASDLYPGLLI